MRVCVRACVRAFGRANVCSRVRYVGGAYKSAHACDHFFAPEEINQCSLLGSTVKEYVVH